MRLRACVMSSTLLLGATLASAQDKADTMPAAVVERAVAAFNAHDVEALMSVYAPDAESYRLAAGDSAGRGPFSREKLRASYAGFFKEFPKHRGKTLATIVNGPYVVKQFADEAGVPKNTQLIFIYEVRAGKIRRYWQTPSTPVR